MRVQKRISLAVTLVLAVTMSAGTQTAHAGWGDMQKMNKWFEDQKGKTYTIEQAGPMQKAPTGMQVPGKIQTPGNLQIPRGIKAISKVEKNCEHRFVIGADTLFPFDKSFLTPQAEETLKVLGPMIKKEGNHPVKIEGHTDAIGDVAYNQELSEKRARTVNMWLEANDYLIAPAAVSGFGKSRPIAPNTKPDGSDDPVGRQKNRRVEIVIDTCTTVDPVARKVAPTTPTATTPATTTKGSTTGSTGSTTTTTTTTSTPSAAGTATTTTTVAPSAAAASEGTKPTDSATTKDASKSDDGSMSIEMAPPAVAPTEGSSTK